MWPDREGADLDVRSAVCVERQPRKPDPGTLFAVIHHLRRLVCAHMRPSAFAKLLPLPLPEGSLSFNTKQLPASSRHSTLWPSVRS